MHLFVALTILLYTASRKRITKIPTFLGVTRANIRLSQCLAQTLLINLAIRGFFIFPPPLNSVSAPPAEIQIYHIFTQMQYVYFARFLPIAISVVQFSTVLIGTVFFFATAAGLC